MEPVKRKGFSRFDVVLGVGVLAVVAAGLPWLGQQLDMAKNARSRDHAAVVAQAILDYHTEMGQWPAAHGQPVDLTVLTAVPPATHTMGTMAAPDDRPWIEELPVDSWGRPFVAAIFDEDDFAATGPGLPAGASRAYPMAPPPGATIVVVSAGHDGILQSNLDTLADLVPPTYLGDDTGQVLRGRANGEGS
jgi:type II secretory pathway pseudopilin PulG